MRLQVLIVPEWHPWPEAPVEGSWVREQARAAALECDVAILATRPGAPTLRPRLELTESVEEGLRTVRVRYAASRLPKATFARRVRAMAAGAAHLRRSGFTPEVVHAHVFSAGFPAALLARRMRVPLVVSEHYTGFPRGTLSRWDRLIAKRTFRAADLVCPASADLARHLERLQRHARFRPMPNVVDTNVFFPPAAELEGPARLLNVASLHDKKGHAHLLRAFAHVRSERPDALLEVVGDGPRRAELERLAERLGVGGVVRFLGTREKDEVAQLMRSAHLFVLASLWENAPHVVIEALASGLPVVATDVGGVAELLPPEAGTLVPAADPDAFARAALELLERQSQLDREALAATAEARFGHEAVGRLWAEVYGELAGR